LVGVPFIVRCVVEGYDSGRFIVEERSPIDLHLNELDVVNL
jgi:hypothetical protein